MKTESEVFAEDAEIIFKEAWDIAHAIDNGFISLEHLFVAMLRSNCLAEGFLNDFDTAEQYKRLLELYTTPQNKKAEDKIPLTMQTERVVRHSKYIATLNNHINVNSVHILLSILSYENPVSEQLKTKGIIYEDIASSFIPENIAKVPLEIKLRKFRYNKIASRLRVAPSLNRLIEEIHDHAINLWTYQQYSDCQEACIQGIKINAEHSGLHELMAYASLKKKDFDIAIAQFELLLKRFPESIPYQISQSFCYDKKQQYLQSASMLDQVLIQEPNNTAALNNKGFNLIKQEKYQEAIPYFEKAIQLEPSHAYAWNNLGYAKFKSGEPVQGLSSVEKSLELNKGNAYGHRNKGIILLEQNNKENALKSFGVALKYDLANDYKDEISQYYQQCLT